MNKKIIEVTYEIEDKLKKYQKEIDSIYWKLLDIRSEIAKSEGDKNK